MADTSGAPARIGVTSSEGWWTPETVVKGIDGGYTLAASESDLRYPNNLYLVFSGTRSPGSWAWVNLRTGDLAGFYPLSVMTDPSNPCGIYYRNVVVDGVMTSSWVYVEDADDSSADSSGLDESSQDSSGSDESSQDSYGSAKDAGSVSESSGSGASSYSSGSSEMIDRIKVSYFMEGSLEVTFYCAWNGWCFLTEEFPEMPAWSVRKEGRVWVIRDELSDAVATSADLISNAYAPVSGAYDKYHLAASSTLFVSEP